MGRGAHVGVVAAVGNAQHQVWKARQNRRPQLGILRSVTKLQCHQIGTPFGQCRQCPFHRIRVPRRQVQRWVQPYPDVRRKTQQRVQLVAAGELLTLQVVDLSRGRLQGRKVGRRNAQCFVAGRECAPARPWNGRLR